MSPGKPQQPIQDDQTAPSPLAGPAVNPDFKRALEALVAVAHEGHRPDSPYFNPPNDWLLARTRVLQDLPSEEQDRYLREWEEIKKEAAVANAEGKAGRRAGPDVACRLDSGGLAFYSQLGVARRPDLTQYFIDGFPPNRDALAFSEENQALFAEIIPYLTKRLETAFTAGDTVVQSDRQVCDAPRRSFHARQLLVGTHYLQLPYMWRQLTFDLPRDQWDTPPGIVELSVPNWLEDLGLPDDLKKRALDVGITQLVFKAPTLGLSLHLGFDYVGEHKMGPLSIAMWQVKEANGIALQAALSTARVRSMDGQMQHVALVTTGPSLHGKSTLTIMIEFHNSVLARLLQLPADPEEGVYPMNDDIVLVQPFTQPQETTRDGHRLRISHGIDGTENSFYAVPFGLNREDDPITYDVVRGTPDAPNAQETLENVVADPATGAPDFSQNPVRNMRMVLSRSRLLERKGAQGLLAKITGGRMAGGVHVPLEDTDRVLWQAVMRQNTVVPPLRRLRLEQYVRVLMYGEAVQMGAAAGVIGRPYVEYFSDPFIIGLEDENANVLHYILQQLERGGIQQEFYAFNTGGVGADTNDEASGPHYKKIPRELTLMLQEAVLRNAVKYEYDSIMGADVAVAITDASGNEMLDLRPEWLPHRIYGDTEYARRVVDLRRRRYYGRDEEDKAGILRYTKVTDALIDFSDVPPPLAERELARLLSFYWHLDQAYTTLEDVAAHRHEGLRPAPHLLRALRQMYLAGVSQGLALSGEKRRPLEVLGLGQG